MKGSFKQVYWAEDIRKEFIRVQQGVISIEFPSEEILLKRPNVNTEEAQARRTAKADKARELIEKANKIDKAKFWIENRNNLQSAVEGF